MCNTIQVKKKYYFVSIMKACAAILIINSHYDSIYPVPALATGGAIGNAIFFAVSGFCLYPIMKDLKEWICEKIVKIYIPMLLMTTIALLTYLRGFYSFSIISFISIFIWPTVFWFVGAIILFYFLYYLFRNIRSNKHYIVMGIAFIVIYSIYYIVLLDTSSWVIETKGLNSIESCFKLIYYFAAMMLGKWFRINVDKVYSAKMLYVLGMLLSFCSVYGVKFFVYRYKEFMFLQFLNQISILSFVYFAFSFMLLSENRVKRYRDTKIYRCATYVSNITLHLYLVQFLVIEYASKIIFPINFMMATLGIIFMSILLKYVSDFICNKLFCRKGK